MLLNSERAVMDINTRNVARPLRVNKDSRGEPCRSSITKLILLLLTFQEFNVSSFNCFIRRRTSKIGGKRIYRTYQPDQSTLGLKPLN